MVLGARVQAQCVGADLGDADLLVVEYDEAGADGAQGFGQGVAVLEGAAEEEDGFGAVGGFEDDVFEHARGVVGRDGRDGRDGCGDVAMEGGGGGG
ncbi:MAG: hypothetical protein ABFD89_05300 [Bryobacteraceae bacterium]